MRRALLLLLLATAATGGLRSSSARADARGDAAAGARFLAQGRWSEAEESYARATRGAPGMVSAWVGLGEVYARSGRFERAESVLAVARGLAPDDTAAPLLLARIRLASDSPARATALAREILARHPGEAGAIRILGFARWSEGDDEEAERAFRLALRRDARDAEASFGLALARQSRGDTLAALAALRATLAGDPAHLTARRRLAWILEAIGRPREAETEYRAAQAVASAAGSSVDALDLARLLAARGAASEAESVLGGAVTPEGDPGAARVFFARAALLERAGDLAAARDLFRAAFLARPEDPVVRVRYEDLLEASLPSTDTERVRLAERRLGEARAERGRGDLPEAERLLRRAVRLAPQISEIRLEKARLLAKRAAYADALQEAFWARELTRDPAERFQIADAEERWVNAGLDRLETTVSASFRDLRLAPIEARRDFLRDPAALETRLGWLPGPWPRPRVVLRLDPFTEATPPFHAEIGRTLDRFLEEALREREEIEVRPGGGAAGETPYDVRVRGEISEREDWVRIRFRLEKANGERVLERTVEARGLDASAQASNAMARALLAAVAPQGEILRIEGNSVYVNLGARNGLRAGDTLAVVALRTEGRIPGLRRPGLEVRGRLVVEAVEERFARAAALEDPPLAYGLLARVRRDEP